MYRTANVLDGLPKRLQRRAKKHLHRYLPGRDEDDRAERGRGVREEVRRSVYEGRHHSRQGRGGAVHVLRLSGHALANDPKHQRHRVGVRDGTTAHACNEGSRIENPRTDDGLPAPGHGTETMEEDPDSSGRGRTHERNETSGRKERLGRHCGGTEERCLISPQFPASGHISVEGVLFQDTFVLLGIMRP